MSSNVGKVIHDFYCNGFFGRRYDLTDSIIEGEGKDWIVIRLRDGKNAHASIPIDMKQEYINNWTDVNLD